jgi:hypothetical protein
MKSRILIFLTLLFSATSLIAQEATDEPHPPQNGQEDSVQGVFIEPVEGAPFSATVEIKETRSVDGTTLIWSSIDKIARDSTGRIHNELRQAMSESITSLPELFGVHIFDPQSRMNTYYDPRTKMASQRVLARPPIDLNARLLALHKPQSTDLGRTIVNGIECRGTLETYVIPASNNGAENPVTFTDEFWYSEELHINILIRHTDSHGNEKTVEVHRIKRKLPDPALFEVPDDYKIVDVTPPPSTLVRHSKAQ